jgi:hypothetical protein
MFITIPMLVVIGFVFVASNYSVAKKGSHWKKGDKVGKEGNALCILWVHGNNELPCVVISRTLIRFGSLRKRGRNSSPI